MGVIITKPEYKVPSMQEIAALPHNGFNAISTFSGCGGSSLGYKMAGFRVLWASEFIPAAQEVYRANHKTTILDTRDIRQVDPSQVLELINKKPGEIDLMDGSPPCASFSTSGAREAGWGKVKTYSDTKQRTDDLFFQFTRMLKHIQPKTFVAENVSGLVKGTAKGYFIEILKSLRSCGYRVKCKVLDAQWLGVPQTRARTIFVGVRNDLELDPVHPKPLSYRYTITDACPWVAGKVQECEVEDGANLEKYCTGKEWQKLKVGEQSEKYFNLVRTHPDKPSPCICASHGSPGSASPVHPFKKRKFAITELKRLCGFPDDFVLTGDYKKQYERLGRAVPPVMMSHVARCVRDNILEKM
ncbi:MAG: DNA cytosine methyltransferase [Pirellulales bacterium]